MSSTSHVIESARGSENEKARFERVYVWEFPVRLYHWVNAVCVFALIVTGFIIGQPTTIRYAEEGFPVSELIAHYWALSVPRLSKYPGFTEQFTIRGRAPKKGEIWKNEALARTLETLAAEGRDAFYRGEPANIEGEFCPNEGILLKAMGNPKQTARGIYRHDSKLIEPLQHADSHPWGLSARNLQQHFALELLLREDIQLVPMLGQAGTGKTLLALAVGLQLVAEEKRYRRIMVSRPIMPLGKDIGYLPGSGDTVAAGIVHALSTGSNLGEAVAEGVRLGGENALRLKPGSIL